VNPGRRAAALLLAAGVLFGAGAAGFLLYRLTAPERPALRRPALPAAGSASSGAGLPSEPKSIPEQLPDFSLPDTEGHPHRLADWKGRALVVNFWATWCEPCRREIPLLEALRRENTSKNIEVVGIAVDHPDSVRKFVQELRVQYPVLVGENGGLEAVEAFGIDTIVLPFTVFADAEGRIVGLKIGELHRDEAAFILARLADLGAGRLSLPAAREQVGDYLRRAAVSRAAAGQE